MCEKENKRTAHAVAEGILERRVDPSQIRTAVDAAKPLIDNKGLFGVRICPEM